MVTYLTNKRKNFLQVIMLAICLLSQSRLAVANEIYNEDYTPYQYTEDQDIIEDARPNKHSCMQVIYRKTITHIRKKRLSNSQSTWHHPTWIHPVILQQQQPIHHLYQYPYYQNDYNYDESYPVSIKPHKKIWNGFYIRSELSLSYVQNLNLTQIDDNSVDSKPSSNILPLGQFSYGGVLGYDSTFYVSNNTYMVLGVETQFDKVYKKYSDTINNPDYVSPVSDIAGRVIVGWDLSRFMPYVSVGLRKNNYSVKGDLFQGFVSPINLEYSAGLNFALTSNFALNLNCSAENVAYKYYNYSKGDQISETKVWYKVDYSTYNINCGLRYNF